MYKILIVEDELIPAEYLKSILETRGWEVVAIVDNCKDTIKSVKKYKPNLILMDIMINGSKSGCETAIEIRKTSNCAIIFTTSYANEEMISYAMEIQAEGYMIKPYNEKEIIATISLLSAKQNGNNNHFKITRLIGGFSYIHESNLLYKDAQIVKLGPKAIKLIQILCSHRDKFVSYKKLYEYIWEGEINLKKLQMVVYRIREVCEVDFLENINGVGYQIKIDHSFHD
ncbi:response regulator [Sulfurospirillum arcachonense]|uniref:response regulator n=1 Tax=Sulfurospirillum arcachonense TaxID=57666 RepID=UPI000468AE2F|nr:response regulator [Sulfurospirillum arcachonense]